MSARTFPSGHALLLVLSGLAALGAASAVVASRFDGDLAARRSEDLRTQALWLARSAAATGAAGTLEVPLEHGSARVVTKVSGAAVEVEVTLAGTGTARASVRRGAAHEILEWSESFERQTN